MVSGKCHSLFASYVATIGYGEPEGLPGYSDVRQSVDAGASLDAASRQISSVALSS